MEDPSGTAGNYRIDGAVLIGANEDLFLAGGRHNVLDFALGKIKVDQKSIDNCRANLESRRAFLDKRNIGFAQIVAPEKWKVYPGNFPVQEPHSLADQYLAAGCDFVYPVERFRNEQAGPTYFRTDTHWTAYGQWCAVEMIAELAKFTASEMADRRAEAMASLQPEAAIFYGDLGRKLNPQIGETKSSFRLRHKVVQSENGITHDYSANVNDGRLIVVKSDHAQAKKRLLIFGDSYLHPALLPLSYFFDLSVFCRTRFVHREMVEMVQPDVVVAQQAERYLSAVASDEEAPPFLLLPALMGRAPNFTRKTAELISAALSGDRAPNFALFPPSNAQV